MIERAGSYCKSTLIVRLKIQLLFVKYGIAVKEETFTLQKRLHACTFVQTTLQHKVKPANPWLDKGKIILYFTSDIADYRMEVAK